MPTFSRDEVMAAWRHRMDLQDRDDWHGFGMTFTEDGVYIEHHHGTFRGRKEILAWLVPVMEPCRGWSFPVEWVCVDGNRVVHKWLNRLPGKRADGSHYEFAGLTVMEYAGNGLFSLQEDIYNRNETDQVVAEWKAASAQPERP
jgi:limonene-1,2-epoxide hydrolase